MAGATVPVVAGTTLERRYRRLLWSYPGGYRAARADELVGTLLDLAAPGRRWPTVPEAVDLALGGLRERLRRPLVAGAEAGLAIAAPVALGLAGALALFCALVVEPAPAGYASFGGYRTVGPVAYAAWVLAVAVHSVRPGRVARWATGTAMALTAGLPVAAFVAGAHRPPLWVLGALLCLGALALAGGQRRPGPTERVAVPAGSLLAAAAAQRLLLAWPAHPAAATGYYQPCLYLLGAVFGAVVVGLAGTGGYLARRGGTGARGGARPWLWAALLLALPGSWLGPGPLHLPNAARLGSGLGSGLSTGLGTGLGFGRVAEVLTGSAVVLAAMGALVGRRDHGVRWPAGGLPRAGGVATGVAAGLTVALAAFGAPASPAAWAPAGGWVLASALAALPGRLARPGAALLGVLATVLAGRVAGHGTAATGTAVTATLAVLAVLALAGAVTPEAGTGPRAYPLVVALVTALAGGGLAVYDAGWHLTRPTAGYPLLLLTLAVVPCALAAVAGLAGLRPDAGRSRIAGLAALACGGGWLAALALPSLPSWGPVLLAVPLGGAALAGHRLYARVRSGYPRRPPRDGDLAGRAGA